MAEKLALKFFLCLWFLAALVGTSSTQSSGTWHTSPFGGDDAKFVAARKQILKEFGIQKDHKTWIESYLKTAKKEPLDSLAQFNYAYAVYQTVSKGREDSEVMKGPYDRMLKISPPYTLPYARLLFAIEFYFFPNRNLVSVGRRLHKELPSDHHLAWQLGTLLCQEPNLGIRREGLLITEKALKAMPKDVGLRYTYGMCAYNVFYKSKTKKDAEVAIEAFSEYLKMAPDNKTQKRFRNASSAYISQLKYFLKNPKAFEKWGG